MATIRVSIEFIIVMLTALLKGSTQFTLNFFEILQNKSCSYEIEENMKFNHNKLSLNMVSKTNQQVILWKGFQIAIAFFYCR